MRRTLAALCALFVLTTAGTCDDEPTSPSSVAGTYALVSVNGNALPASFEGSTISGGSIVINPNNTFSYTESYTGEPSFTLSGTWSVSGSTYTFHPTSEQGQSDGTGTFSGNTLTITTVDQVLVFNKQ